MPTISGYGGYAGALHGTHVPLPQTARKFIERPTPAKKFTVPLLNPTEFTEEQVAASAPRPARRRGGGRPTPPSGTDSPFSITSEKIDQIVELYQSGMTRLQVAAEAGVAQATVAKYLKARGVQVRPRGVTRRRPAVQTPAVKTCAAPDCGKEFTRREGERVDSWQVRRTCSQRCKGVLSGITRKGRSQRRTAA